MSKTVSLMSIVIALALAPCCSGEPLHEQIDRHIAVAAGGDAAGPAVDAEFLRRVYLDLAGVIPPPDVARSFLDDGDQQKRAKLIDRLLASPDYARRMQHALTVMLLERRAAGAVSDQEWDAFVSESFAANKPWDQFVRELIAADGREEKTRPGIRFFADGGRNSHHQMTQDVARIFLGMNVQCAQCHDHPNVEGFLQSHYFGIYAYLQQTVVKTDKKLNKPVLAENVAAGKTEFQSVFLPDDKHATGPRLPGGEEIAIPAFEKGQELAQPAVDGSPAIPKFRPRERLSKELASAENDRFVRNSVNRFWFLMMGRGLVHPLDMMHGRNPASHPELLKLLAAEFVATKFDVKNLLREIALSDAYQRSSRAGQGVELAKLSADRYRVSQPRPLSAEQMAFSLLQATGNLSRVLAADVPDKSSFTYNDYINGRIPAPENLPDVLTLFRATFGNPPGEAEVEFRPSVKQSLFLINEQLVMQWLQANGSNLPARLAKIETPAALAEELYLSVLTRKPSADESRIVAGHLEKQSARDEAIRDLVWSLLTSAEFRLNH